MVRGVTMAGGQWFAIGVALVGVWMAIRNIARVYREHCAEDFSFAEEEWRYADAWWEHARAYCGADKLELRRRCVRNALASERVAAKWFVKGCGG